VGLGFGLAGYATAIALFAAILTITVVLWSFSLLDEFVPPLIAVLISLFIGLAPASEALGSFASPTFFTLLGVFALAAGMKLSGLAERVGLVSVAAPPQQTVGATTGVLGHMVYSYRRSCRRATAGSR